MSTEVLQESKLKAYEIPLDEIYSDDEFNCRGSIMPLDVLDLSRSIGDHGLQQAIVIQPWTKEYGKKYRIVSGHRRYMAFKILNRKTIPAVVTCSLDELTARKMNLEENLKRKDLNILQEANALRPFWSAKWTEEMVASELSQSRGWVQARKALIRLPEEIQQEAAAGFLTQEHVKQLATIKNREDQFAAVKKIKQAKLTGEKRTLTRAVPKKQDPMKKRARDANEIFEMQDTIRQVLGNNFATFMMGWCAGHNSTFEVYKELKDQAEKIGKRYIIPASILKEMM